VFKVGNGRRGTKAGIMGTPLWWHDGAGAQTERVQVGTAVAPAHQRHSLMQELREMAARGEIAQNVYNPRITKGVFQVEYIRLAKRRQAARGVWVPVLVAAVVMALLAVGYLLWESRYVFPVAIAGAALATLIAKKSISHRGACIGIHCPGCRG